MTDITKGVLAGDQIAGEWWPPAVQVDNATDESNVTSTALTTGATVVALNFYAPRSGRVVVALNAAVVQQEASNRVFVTYELYEGSDATGTLKRSGRVQFGVSSSGDATASLEMSHGNMSMVDNLTPGALHYARVMHQVEAGTTNDVTHRRLIVFPVP